MTAYPAFVFVKLLILLLRPLPLRWVDLLGRALGGLAWFLPLPQKKLILANLEVAFGSMYSLRQLRQMARETFKRLARNALAAAWISAQDDEKLKSCYTIYGSTEHLLPALAEGKGVVHVMFHMGNWELLARVAASLPGLTFSTIYQPLRNKHLDDLIQSWRKKSGVNLINRHTGFLEAIARLRKGEAVAMLADQHAGDHGMWVPFFDRLASTTTLPALLSRRTGAPIIPIFCHQDRATHWNIHFGKPIHARGRKDGDVMAEIHRSLEKAIRKDPPNWFWVHQRWKTPSPNFLLSQYRRGIHVPEGARLKPFRIMVRSANWLGDAVMTLPAIQAIKKGRPDCHLTVLCPSKLTDFWKLESCVDEVRTSLDDLRKAPPFAAAILFPNSFRSAWEAWRLGIPRRVGYAGHGPRAWLLTAVCPEELRSGSFEHEVKDFCALARWCGASITSEIPRFPVRKPAGELKDWYLVLHPGAAFGSAKRWIGDSFVQLVQRFPQARWKIIGSGEERERNAELASRMAAGKARVENHTGQHSLSQLVDVLAGARAVVCNDSGPMHLAASIGTPVVAIFGSTEPAHTGPLGEGHRVVRSLVECSPCYLKECPIDLRCMKNVSVDQVESALRDVLAR
jgi:heptosyltransferase II